MPLQIRRGTEAERLAMTQPLAAGELLFVTDTQRVYVGTGATLGGVQTSGFTENEAKDAAAAIFTGGTHSGINFSYDTISNLITATVDLSGYTGPVNVTQIKGSVFADDSTLMVDGTSGIIVAPVVANVTGNVTGNLTGNVYGNVLGNLTGNTTGFHYGDIKGSVFADDSSKLIDAVEGKIVGPVFGNVTGNLTGNVTGNVNGDLLGNVTGNLLGNVTGDLLGNVVGNTSGYHTGDVSGSVFGANSTLLVDAIDNIFYGTIDTGASNLNSSSLTSTGLFNIGTADSPITVVLNLNNNLSINQICDGLTPKGYISTTTSRGTLLSPAALQPGDELGGLIFNGYTNGVTSAIAGIVSVFVDPTAVIAGGNYIKTQIAIGAATDTGQNVSDAMVLDSAGSVSSNSFVANKYFKLPVFANDAARSAAIPTPAKGMMCYMTSGTSPAATDRPQFYNGTSWITL